MATLTAWDLEIIEDFQRTIRTMERAIEGKQDDERVRPQIGDAAVKPVSYWKEQIAWCKQQIESIRN